MLFDRDGLEMATQERVAAYHASRFPSRELVFDLASGIGSDLIALAGRGPATGIELDPVRAEYGLHNLAVHGRSCEVIVGDALAVPWQAEYAYCDPARRSNGRRTLHVAEFSPDPRAIAERFRTIRLGGIKLSPMLPDRVLESFEGELEFVSYRGECREALVWLGLAAATNGRLRTAVHVESGTRLAASAVPYQTTPLPSRYLFEADPAAIRAHCLGGLCAQYGLRTLGDSNGYLTGDDLVDAVWLRTYEVLGSHSADLRRTKLELARLGGGTPVVKSRAPSIDVAKLRHDLAGEGRELVVIAYPDGRSLRHAICRMAG